MKHNNSWTGPSSCGCTDSSSLHVHCPCEVCKGCAVYRKAEKKPLRFFFRSQSQRQFFPILLFTNLIRQSKLSNIALKFVVLETNSTRCSIH